MIPTTCKRLIEVDFPIAAVSAHSAREKYIREGHPSTLHLWWARRPLAACRAVLLGLLVPDPCDKDCPLDFKTAARELLAKRYGIVSKTDGELREMLLKFIGEFANWDHAANAMYLEIGRGLVKAAHPEETPVVVDPFAGGGSIPLEALRLGCEAFASDLNPVACLILKTLLEDIPRYGNAEFKLKDDKGKEVVVHGLADALRHVGKQVKEAAEQDLAQFYPPEPDGSQAIAYLWARTVRCEGIGCGAEIPLVRSLWLSKKPERRRALRYCIRRPKDEPPQVVFEILQPKTEEEVGTGFVAGGKATCPCCNVVLPAVRVRAQLTAQRGGGDAQFDKKGQRFGGAILLAVVTLRADTSGRVYRLPLDRDYVAVWKARMAADKLPKGIIPDEPVNPVRPSPNARGLSAVTRFGIVTFGDLFTVRQKLTLAALGRQCAKAEPEMRFALALATSRVSERLTTLSRWDNSAKMESIAGTFSRQALQFVWDFAEQNPFKEIGGNWDGAVDWIALVAGEGGTGSVGQVALADACASPLIQGSVDLWFTDPPYYDSIPYADLSDFFFVWLKRALPNHALLNARGDPGTGLTPKTEECVWNQSHFVDGQPKDGAFFERTITRAFLEGRRVLKADGISCVVFAHKTTEGWEALLSGMFTAGFVITASWPVTTEMATRAVARDTAALAGSVHLVCRPRPADAGVGDWTIVKAAMEKRIREWLPTLVKHGVRGADAIFSCLGPALESYSKYEKVLTAADREVPLGGDPDAIEPEQRGFLDQLAGEKGRALFSKTAPGTKAIGDLFRLVGKPVLILFDETLNYIGRHPEQVNQFHSFMQNLTVALTSSDRAVGLFSLPASPTEMTDGLREWQDKLTKVVGRVGKDLVVNDASEVSEIVRRRLFEECGRESMRRAVSRQFAGWVFSHRDRLPPEWGQLSEDQVRTQFEACYPFHPATLTVFQRKWQALQQFQQTRTTLAMLGMWISCAYHEGYGKARREPLLTLGSAPLADREFLSAVLRQMGEQRLQAAIHADISAPTGQAKSHAESLDDEDAEGAGRTMIHQRVAKALFFESCGGQTDKSAHLPELYFAVGDPDTETALVHTAVQDLERRCYFLRGVGVDGWRFGHVPTLKKVHADRKQALDQEDVVRNMSELVRKVFQKDAEIHLSLFPKDSTEVVDQAMLTMAVLRPDETIDPGEESGSRQRITEWTRKCGQSSRQNPGGVLWMTCEGSGSLKSAVEELLAWQAVADDANRGTLGNLEPEDVRRIQRELNEAKGQIEDRVWSSYNRLLLWDASAASLKEISLGQLHQSEARSITSAILARMRHDSLLSREIGASYIERNWPPALKESGIWPLAGLKAAFFQGQFTRLEKADDALRQTLIRAVGEGLLGMACGKDAAQFDHVWFKETVEAADITFDYDTYILTAKKAKVLKEAAAVPPSSKSTPPTTPVPLVLEQPVAPPPGEPQLLVVSWRGQLRRDQFNLFSLKVLTRLAQAENLEIEVRVRAKLKEAATLEQLNAALKELGIADQFRKE